MGPKGFVDSIDVSSRSRRRRAAGIAVALLERIRQAEAANLARIPHNLKGGYAYANAEYSFDAVISAISDAKDAYSRCFPYVPF